MRCQFLIGCLGTMLWLSGEARAQAPFNYTFRHIDHTNGLMNDKIYSIAQDSTGFIWIGTANGLQRYDGSRFVDYREQLLDREKNMALIDAIRPEGGNRLWLSVNYRPAKLELLTHRFTGYDTGQFRDDSGFRQESYTDPHNNLWLLGAHSLYYCDSAYYSASTDTKKGGTFFYLPYDKPNQTAFVVRDTTRAISWINSLHGVLLFDGATKKVYTGEGALPDHPLRQRLVQGLGANSRKIKRLMLDSRNNLWILTWTDLFYRFDQSTGKTTIFSLSAIMGTGGGEKNADSSLIANCIFQDNHGHIWVGTENAGLLEYDADGDSFYPVTDPDRREQGVQYNYIIICIFQDREENIWLGTDKGISIFNPYRQYFRVIRHERGTARTLPGREINAFIQTVHGDILIGTWGGGISVYDRQMRFKKNIVFSGPYEKNLTWCFVRDDAGSIWVGCQHGYLHIIDPDDWSVRTLHPPELQGSTVRCMEKDALGNIWFGLHNGKISLWDKHERKFYPYADGAATAGQSFAPVVHMLIDHSGNGWVSTEKGFRQFDPVRKIFTATYGPDAGGPNTLSASSCQGIEEYDDSILLIGTINGGLDFFNKRTKRFSRLTMEDSFPSNTVCALKKDPSGHIWFTTDYGIYQFLPAGNKFVSYNIGDGNINSPFQACRFYPTQEGSWLTSTLTELVYFYPDSLAGLQPDRSTVTITGFKISGKPFSIDSVLYRNEPVRLSYRQNFLDIEFAALNFSDVQPMRYDYRLTGIDKDWVNADSKRLAGYTNLGPGKYTFQVRSGTGNITGPITSFAILILPPFWATVWFRVLCLALAGGLIIMAVRARIRAIRNEEARKTLFNKQLAEMELKALRSQMNPHFMFNSLNSINSYILENDVENASEYLTVFSRLMRMILDNSQQLFNTIDQELKILTIYLQLEHMRFGSKFDYAVTISKDINTMDTLIPSMLLQPYIENAIWHGLMHKAEKGMLRVGMDKRPYGILITIEDNGIGRRRSAEIARSRSGRHISKGMKLTEERMRLLTQEKNAKIQVTINDLYDDTGKPGGTRVEITI